MLEAVAGDASIISALMTAAEGFARSRGKSCLRGPFSLSINDECGLLIQGFDTPPAMMMGHAPPSYAQALDALAYVKAKDLVTYELPVVGEVPPKTVEEMAGFVRAEEVGFNPGAGAADAAAPAPAPAPVPSEAAGPNPSSPAPNP